MKTTSTSVAFTNEYWQILIKYDERHQSGWLAGW